MKAALFAVGYMPLLDGRGVLQRAELPHTLAPRLKLLCRRWLK